MSQKSCDCNGPHSNVGLYEPFPPTMYELLRLTHVPCTTNSLTCPLWELIIITRVEERCSSRQYACGGCTIAMDQAPPAKKPYKRRMTEKRKQQNRAAQQNYRLWSYGIPAHSKGLTECPRPEAERPHCRARTYRRLKIWRFANRRRNIYFSNGIHKS